MGIRGAREPRRHPRCNPVGTAGNHLISENGPLTHATAPERSALLVSRARAASAAGMAHARLHLAQASDAGTGLQCSA